jgi:CheY-like chemotaxis protein
MKILIIDDSDYKIQSLQALVNQSGLASRMEVARSFQSGLRAIKDMMPDLVLLDMTLPTSERQDGRLEGRTRIFGVREILAEMELEDIRSRVIVVTQFDHFGEPPNAVNLAVLLEQLKEAYPSLFIGGVYYSNVDSAWQGKLRTILEGLEDKNHL